MGVFVLGSNSSTIYIDHEEITDFSKAVPANEFDVLMAVIIHERLHEEHGHGETSENIEKTTWIQTATRYREVFGKESPLVHGSGTYGDRNPDYRIGNDCITCDAAGS